MSMTADTGNWTVDTWREAAIQRRRRLFYPPTARQEAPIIKIVPPPAPSKRRAKAVIRYSTPAGPFRPFTLNEEYLRQEHGEGTPRVPALKIISEVAAEYGVTVDEIRGPRRHGDLVKPRHAAMCRVYLQRPDMTLPEIGRLFRKDHTTVLHAIKRGGAWPRVCQLEAAE